MQAIQVTDFGDNSVVEVTERERPDPGPEQVRVEVKAAGVNFADIMQRRGHYQRGPKPPYVAGMEMAGVVDAGGEGTDREVGDRVMGFADGGAFAEYTLASAGGLLDAPEGMSFAEAAGVPVQFLTAHNCLFEWGGLEEGERVLVHAAAGGVGTAAVQLADDAGAEVFGTASTREKLDLAADLGCDHPINYTETDFVAEVEDITDGGGLDLVLDGVGGETSSQSLEALTEFGRIVCYGAASGQPGQLDTGELLFNNYTVYGYHLGRGLAKAPTRVLEAVGPLNEGLATGDLEVVVGHEFDLTDAAEALQFIEDRNSSGKVVLKP